jgi:hypothetical protein
MLSHRIASAHLLQQMHNSIAYLPSVYFLTDVAMHCVAPLKTLLCSGH